MSVTGSVRPPSYRIGRVFSDTFSVLGRNLTMYIGLALIFSGIPTFLYQLWAGLQAENAFADPTAAQLDTALGGLVYLAIYMVLGSVLQAALIRATIEDLNGQQPTFGDALSRGFAVLLPIIGLSLLWTIGVGIGMALLIVPGVYLLLRWSAAVPALVNERRGVFESFARSAELTKGNRWPILGLFVILAIVVWVLQLALGVVLAVGMSALGTVVASALASLVSTVTSTIMSIALAVSYVELRFVKEGTDVDELAKIFA